MDQNKIALHEKEKRDALERTIERFEEMEQFEKQAIEIFQKQRSISRVFIGLAFFSSLAVFAAATILIILYLPQHCPPEVFSDFLALYLSIMAAILVVMLLAAGRVVRKRIIRPLVTLSSTTKQYVKDRSDGVIDDFCFSNMKIDTGDEFQELGALLAGMEQDIAESEQQLIQATTERQRIRTELSVAYTIQENMLPNLFPPFPGRTEFEIYASMSPAKEVGGDFYDFFLIDETHLGLVIADVSGKGIPAALFMMSSMIIIDNYASLGYSPSKVLELSNEAICKMELADMFVTVWFGILDLETGVVTAANAGHEYPAICQAGGDFALMKAKHGFVVGGMEGLTYREYSFTMKPGSALFLYTDGVAEATNTENEQYGTKRMLAALNRNKELAPRRILEQMRLDIDAFVGAAPQFDDLTMLCIRYLGKKK